LQNNPPHIIVGCPGRLHELVRNGYIKLNNVKYFVVDECDKMLFHVNMRYLNYFFIFFRDKVQNIFVKTPKEK